MTQTKSYVTFTNVIFKDKNFNLGAGDDRTLRANMPLSEMAATFFYETHDEKEVTELLKHLDGVNHIGYKPRMEWMDSVDLTRDEKLGFVKDGYLVVRDLVPPKIVEDAMKVINQALCTPGGIGQFSSGLTSLNEEVGKSPAVQALLFASGAWTVCQRLLGKGNVIGGKSAQCVLRGPDPSLDYEFLSDTPPGRMWHTDGFCWRGFDKRSCQHSPFTLLVGFTLSDATKPNRGNFSAWPGTHRTNMEPMKKFVKKMDRWMANEPGVQYETSDMPDLSDGVQMLTNPGDVVFAHQKLAHRGGPNGSQDIRYQIYFRLSHKNHQKNQDAGGLLDDLWLEFDGLRDVLTPGQDTLTD